MEMVTEIRGSPAVLNPSFRRFALIKWQRTIFVLDTQEAACQVLNISVAMRTGETPVPIPNTMVKTCPAEDTAGATLWESRWLPNQKKTGQEQGFCVDIEDAVLNGTKG